jgi:mRNA interferase HigB
LTQVRFFEKIFKWWAMHIISKKLLREFWQENPDSEIPLSNWYKLVQKSNWQNPAQLRKDFPQADLVGRCTIFNVGGNKYRLIVKIEYLKQKVFTKFVLTHREYDKNKWKAEC